MFLLNFTLLSTQRYDLLHEITKKNQKTYQNHPEIPFPYDSRDLSQWVFESMHLDAVEIEPHSVTES